ncbi:MAG TPA: 3'-5' exonuclease, partial [Mucilaginibacter sp.]|nr:3'-5' exonuclease [Mucilaginibacter sp.]
YQRKEIKDLIAYFRLTINPNDEEALKRVINYPARGIGDKTIANIILATGHNMTTTWEVVANSSKYLDGRSSGAVEAFATMIQSFQVITNTMPAYDAALHIAKHSGILKDLYNDDSVEGRNRHENIQELLNGIKEFSEREDIEDKSLAVFMQDVALLTNDDKDNDPNADTVSLMTIHSAKGLEFPHVFVVGLEENLFPSQMSLNSRSDLEEERRLFYVAVTRAESKLTISYATSRFKFGTLISCEPSRFLDEIDARYLELDFTAKPAASNSLFFEDERNAWTKRGDTFSKPRPATPSPVKTTSMLAKAHIPTAGFAPSDTSNLQVGMEVEHERFGFGKVLSLEGNKPDVKATIFFKEIGQKQLLLKFAKLRIIIN